MAEEKNLTIEELMELNDEQLEGVTGGITKREGDKVFYSKSEFDRAMTKMNKGLTAVQYNGRTYVVSNRKWSKNRNSQCKFDKFLIPLYGEADKRWVSASECMFWY